MPNRLSRPLLAWYAKRKRRLPWRGAADPYHVWVSEIMLQQTQVETVIPYYQRWLARFPTVQALAAAPLAEVLAQWEGLGYYSRARNLHRAAQKVVAEFGGRLPKDAAALQQLPGVGRYTAGAIASIAFNADSAVLDGNVKRVLARVFNLADDVKSPAGVKKLWALAESLVPAGRAGDFNQALMDLGATICRPQNPACLLCPLRGLCQAQRLGVENERPVVRKKAPTPHYLVTAAIIRRGDQFLVTRRQPGVHLEGAWEFPGGKCDVGEPLTACMARELREELGIDASVGAEVFTVAHDYVDRRVELHFFECRSSDEPLALLGQEMRWVRRDELARLEFPPADAELIRRLVEFDER
jgi:A/G-specific adenine glycosylase